ncbi:MAG: DUF3048 domain-containing protein [Eubacterium sp.]|nr:DUF3048 domain-containing protein [Eubacterium sp.]
MSDHNEIDDILNEIKSKKESENKKDFEIKDKTDNSFSSFDFSEAEEPKLTSSGKSLNDDDTDDKPENNKKKIIIIAVVAILVIAIVAGIVFAVTKSKNKEPETTTTTTTTQTTTEVPVLILNPLTGESEYNENAVGKRPVAVVVENAYAARPQWGIDDSKNSPDIILEGEVEGGETRMLWFYADYTCVPDQIGPIRSARPPFIKFSELFDSIFIHWGQSSSRDNYVGADTVFKTDNVDHINQMTYSDKLGLFGRDKSRGVSSEHTGVLHGNKLEQAIENAKFRTDVNESSFTNLAFNEKDKTVSGDKCTAFAFTFSSNTKTRDWTYSEDDKMYHCTDYLTDVARKNLLVLYDTTEYVAKSNYKGSGKSEIYCNYKLAGGSGKLVSLGVITDITWSVQNGVLKVKDSNGNDVSLNPGKTWIGYGSSNKGGKDKNNTPVESTSAQN